MSSVTRKPIEIIPTDEIKPGSYVRYAENGRQYKNGRQYVAVRDLIMVVNDVSSVTAGNSWRQVFDIFRDDITLHSTSFYFDLKSDNGIKVWESVITFQGAMKLLVLLPRAGHMNEDTCKAKRATMVRILTEYYAGEEPLLAQPAVATVSKPGIVATNVAATARSNAEKAATVRPSTAPPAAPVGAVAAAKPKPKNKSKNSASEKMRDEVELQKELNELDIEHEKAKIALQLDFLKSARKELDGCSEGGRNLRINPWLREVIP